MRVTVRAGEVREGDRLIVPDGEIEVPKWYPSPLPMYPEHVCIVPHYYGDARPMIARHVDERVVVERPDPPITITVELTPREADAVSALWAAYSKSDPATTQQVMAKVAAAIVAAAIVAARTGETQ